MKRFLTVLNGVFTALLVLVIALSAGLAFTARRSGDAVPTVLGRKVMTVLSGSMEPTIHTGDVIIVHPLQNPAEQIKDGDIITFRSTEQSSMLITHRVVGTLLMNGKPVAYTTKGDANKTEDFSVVPVDQVVGRYQWRVPYFGYVTSFLHKPAGIALFVILPGLVIIGLEFRKMWAALSEAEAAKTRTPDGGDKKIE